MNRLRQDRASDSIASSNQLTTWTTTLTIQTGDRGVSGSSTERLAALDWILSRIKLETPFESALRWVDEQDEREHPSLEPARGWQAAIRHRNLLRHPWHTLEGEDTAFPDRATILTYHQRRIGIRTLMETVHGFG
jgi:hypothetical protein